MNGRRAGAGPFGRAIFRCYLRNHEGLTRYVEWLAADKERHALKRILLAVLVRGITRFVLVGKIIPRHEAEAMLAGAQAVGLTDCVCRVCHEGIHAAACLFLDEACAAYAESGPYPLRRVSLAEALAVMEKAAEAGCVFITPVSPLAVRWFPQRYCICACRLDYCLPLRFAQRYGIHDGCAKEIPEYSPRHRLLLCLALVTLPLLWVSLMLFLTLDKPARR